MTATTTQLKAGDAVIYNGSIERERGVLCKVKAVRGTRHDLVYYFDRSVTVVRNARRESLTPVAKKDILTRTCEQCGWGPYWYLRDTDGPCPVRDSH